MIPTLDGLAQTLIDLKSAGRNRAFALTRHWVEDSGITLKQFCDAVSKPEFLSFKVTIDPLTENIIIEYPAVG